MIKHIVSLDREARLLADRFGERLTGCSVVASVVPQHLYGLTFRIVLPMALASRCMPRCSTTPSSWPPFLMTALSVH